MLLYRIVKPLTFAFYRLFYRAKIDGAENIPGSGAVILCSNHLSYNDPILLDTFTKRKLNFMAKAELFKIPVLKSAVRALGAFPVDRNTPDISSFRNGMEILKAGGVLCVFAQGSRFKELDAKDAKPGVALFALKSGAVVVPVKITPGYRVFRRVRIVVGKPVDLSPFAGQKTRSDVLKEAAETIVRGIAEL